MALSLRPSLLLGALIWLGITAYGVYVLFDIKNSINFGIDLVGGTYLTLEVKVNEAVKNELMHAMQMLSDQLKKDNKEIANAPTVNEKSAIGLMVFKSDADASHARGIFESYNHPLVKVTQDGKNLNFSIGGQQLKRLTEEAVENDIAVLRTRLDAYSAGEIAIVPQGEKDIVVELPNVSDPEQAKARIGKAALLEMKPVLDFSHSEDALFKKYNNVLPEGTMIIEGKKNTSEQGYYLVPNFAKITGALLKDARHDVNRDAFFTGSTPDTVAIEFNSEGAHKFYDMTKNHLGDKIAIILDNVVISAPNVNQEISGGKAVISGGFTPEQAKELVMMLKSGSFSAPVEVVQERHIGPSLGKESINQGLISCLIGLALLFLFSIIVYKTAGLFAFIVLIYNLLFILLGLMLIPNATLTLPGIAGMVLTIGMAIDSSILIYERIKEELALGMPLKKAVNSGFSSALTVILDANITTFIVGAVLYYFGSPAIQGFALTMMIGIVSTLITGLLLLKWIFDVLIDSGVQKIKF